MYSENDYNNQLYHHGVKGQKWGVRRYQDYNGQSLVGRGLKKYSNSSFSKYYEKAGGNQSVGRNVAGVIGNDLARGIAMGTVGSIVTLKLTKNPEAVAKVTSGLGYVNAVMTVGEISSRYSGHKNDYKK